MIDVEKRKAIFLLHQEGMAFRDIARKLRVSRNTVKEIVKQRGAMPDTVRSDKIHIDLELLARLYADCEGYAQRMHEKLMEEEDIQVSYSTLTRMLRESDISRPQKDRCDEVPDTPGAEMQHDTSPYDVLLGGKRTRVIASLLYMRYSKRRHLTFYRRFNRFKMKCFLHKALMYWKYAAPLCIIDNTNLARLSGIGKHAVMVPEMKAFARQYGFEFRCHEKGHSNRKAGEERGFWTVETNFFPGRRFRSLEDMNEQASVWATERMYHRRQGKTRVIPAEAFEFERAYLEKIPLYLPAPYLVHKLGTDQYGHIAFNANYYWVPGTRRDEVMVLEYGDRLALYQKRKCIAEYQLPADGVKNEKFSPAGQPKPRYQPKYRKKPTAEEEKRLRAMDQTVNDYLDFALKPKGTGRHRFVRQLFALMQQMSSELFVKTIRRGLRYRITSLDTLRRIALLCMNQGDQMLPSPDVDEGFTKREAYLEGRLTDAPDLSVYDKLLEEDDDG